MNVLKIAVPKITNASRTQANQVRIYQHGLDSIISMHTHELTRCQILIVFYHYCTYSLGLLISKPMFMEISITRVTNLLTSRPTWLGKIIYHRFIAIGCNKCILRPHSLSHEPL